MTSQQVAAREAMSSAASVRHSRHCPSCGWVISKPLSLCPLCQCQIPESVDRGLQSDTVNEDENLPSQSKKLKPSSTSEAVYHREDQEPDEKTQNVHVKEFIPDPRKTIPKVITREEIHYMDLQKLRHRDRLRLFLNNITYHLRAGDSWECEKCAVLNKGALCTDCGSPMYSRKLNRRIQKEQACIHCHTMNRPLDDASCRLCHKKTNFQQDVRIMGFIRWRPNSDGRNPLRLKSDGNADTGRAASFGAETDGKAQSFVESLSSTPKFEKGRLEPLQADVEKGPETKQWASYTPNIGVFEEKDGSSIDEQQAQTNNRAQENEAPTPLVRRVSQDVPLRRVSQDFTLRRVSQGLFANEDADDEQPYSGDELDRMTRKSRPSPSGDFMRHDKHTDSQYPSNRQPDSGENTSQNSSNPLRFHVRRLNIEGPFLSPTERHTNLEAEEPSRMDRRREALAQGLDGGQQPDRRKGYRKPRSEDLIEYDDDASQRQERKRAKKIRDAGPSTDVTEGPTPIYLPDFITVINLATALDININKFTRAMRSLGFEDTNNDLVLDAETAGLIAAEFNFEAIVDVQEETQDLKPREDVVDRSKLPIRPPVVTIMGHVDHGKTTILDYLRKSSIAASEHGGITQHIGAFSVIMPSGRLITFLDTPGHKAFLDMRQRGANVTDIVILVVAADDSVKPQTIEAIKHARGAGVQMIVAINKIDKEDADLDRVKGDLARNGVIIEEFGGDVQVIGVSGKTGEGMADLEEATIALADTLDLRAPTDGTVEGWVLEATTTKAGRVATILVRRGTLNTGQTIVAGSTWTKVRTLRNEAGVEVPFAGPGTPVEVDGWRDQPAAGDEVLQANDESHARSVVDHRIEVSERKQMTEDVSAINETRRLEQEKREREEAEDARNRMSRKPGTLAPDEALDSIGPKEIPLLIKADVSGSVEAVLTSLPTLGNTEVRPHRLRAGVGPVSESDVEHAATAKGHIVAFNTPTENAVRHLAEQKGVTIIEQTIIYRLMEEINKKLSEYLKPVINTKVVGEAEVSQIFEITVKGRKTSEVAGCRVRNGVINQNAKCRVLRRGEVVYDGMPLPFSIVYFLFNYMSLCLH